METTRKFVEEEFGRAESDFYNYKSLISKAEDEITALERKIQLLKADMKEAEKKRDQFAAMIVELQEGE